MTLESITRETVLAAVEEYDRLGRDAFLAKYGFGPAREYFLEIGGRLYDSKAICGAARGFVHPDRGPLSADEFSGGSATVEATLTGLGFRVERIAPTFVLTWNPDRWPDDPARIDEMIAVTERGDEFADRWAVGTNIRQIGPGSRVFLLRQGRDRGIVASGRVTSDVYEDESWERPDESKHYVKVRWDRRVDLDERLPTEELLDIAPGTKWNSIFASGHRIEPTDVPAVERAFAPGRPTRDATFNGDEAIGEMWEGAVKEVRVNRYERDRRARAACIAAHGPVCAACGIDFGERYGDFADGFIHVHHVTPISHIGETYKVDPETDLVPVCPNCHAMLHYKVDAPRSVEELRQMLGR